MLNDAHNSAVDDLDDLLDVERSALLAGDIQAVHRLIDRKESLINKINSLSEPPRNALVPLHQKVQRNQALITSALDGIKAVADRISDIRSVQGTLQTYDKEGKIREIPGDATRTVERRA